MTGTWLGQLQTVGAGTVAAFDGEAARQHKLVDAAHQFEGVLLQEMLKSLGTGKDELGGDGEQSSGSLDTLRGFGTEAVAKAISNSGGIGLAKQVIAKVTKETHQRSAERS